MAGPKPDQNPNVVNPPTDLKNTTTTITNNNEHPYLLHAP